jgi:pyruvate dehydrogenase E2 component (dihydrolipoamide acetyltransferase)
VAVIELLVKPGDTVKAEQSPDHGGVRQGVDGNPVQPAGVVKELKVKLGDKVKQGSVVLVLEAAGAARRPPAPPEQKPARRCCAAAISTVALRPAGGSGGASRPGGSARARHRRLQGRGRHRGAGQARRHHQGGAEPDHRRVGQGVDGNPVVAAGVLKELKVKVGDKVNIGDLVAILEGAGAAASCGCSGGGAAPAAPAPAPGQQRRPAAALRICPAGGCPPHEPGTPTRPCRMHRPRCAKFARELGVPLDEVKGTGPKGRITQDDVQAFTKAVMAGAVQTKARRPRRRPRDRWRWSRPGPDPLAQGGLRQVRPDRAQGDGPHQEDQRRQPAAQRIMIPAVTNHDDADITDLEAFRVSTNKENEKSGIKVTMLAFLIKACVAALKKFPEFNSSSTATPWSTSSTSTSALRPTRPMAWWCR